MLNNRVAVDAAELLRLAWNVDDEIDPTVVAAALRGMATDADSDIGEALERTRRAGLGVRCCHGRHLCAYHEGWSDALDVLEDELS